MRARLLQVEYGASKVFMNRELHGLIEIVRMKEEVKRLRAEGKLPPA